MWTALAGLPGKITTLLNRLSDARATKLDSLDATVSSRMPGTTTHRDRIDAAISSRMPGTVTEQARIDTTISSRAPANTALSNATWSDTRASYIDTTVSSRAPAGTALSNATWSDTRAGHLDKLAKLDPITLAPIASGLNWDEGSTDGSVYSELFSSAYRLLMPAFSRSTTGSATILSVTGRGVLNYFAFGALASSGTKTFTGSVTLTIDGVAFTQAISVTSTAAAAYVSWLPVGSYPFGLDQIPFNQSLVITVNMTSAGGTGTLNGVYKYRQVA